MSKSEIFTLLSLLFSTRFTSKYVVLYGFVGINFSFLYGSPSDLVVFRISVPIRKCCIFAILSASRSSNCHLSLYWVAWRLFLGITCVKMSVQSLSVSEILGLELWISVDFRVSKPLKSAPYSRFYWRVVNRRVTDTAKLPITVCSSASSAEVFQFSVIPFVRY